MKQFIQVKLPANLITIPISSIVLARAFDSTDIPSAGLVDTSFIYKGVQYQGSRYAYKAGDKDISQEEYYEAKGVVQDGLQEQVNQKYAKCKTYLKIKMDGDASATAWLIEDSYEELSAQLTGGSN